MGCVGFSGAARTGCTRIVTDRAGGGAGAASGLVVSFGVPARADIHTTVAIAPVISAAARTRAHVSLMFLPRSVDTPF